jgi:thymidylate synthase (FAD)
MEDIAKLVVVTPEAEKTMAYIARVSNPKNQNNEDFVGLLKYCIKHKHWSVFEHATMTVEINTSLPIATQILRHRSFTFQQFSQRYADSQLLGSDIPIPDLRSQDHNNRQNSIDDIPEDTKTFLHKKIRDHFNNSMKLYNTLLKFGVAKECARFVLPESTTTRLYMTGNCRNWIHYLDLRTGPETQKEHAVVANDIKRIFIQEFPSVSNALGYTANV